MATKHVVAGLIVAAAAVLSAPVAAQAQSYVPSDGCSIDPSSVPAGGSATFTATPGTFGPSSSVDFSITGYDASHALLAAGSASGLGDPLIPSQPNGSAVVSIHLPADATGQYQVSGVDASVGATSECTLTVLPPVTPAVDSTDPSGELALTGQEVYTSMGWIGGGVVLAGVALLVVRRIGRRRASSGR